MTLSGRDLYHSSSMTEPILTDKDLRPLFTLLFRKRFWIVGIFIAGTLASYGLLLVLKAARYDSIAVVMIKVPVVDFEFRIDPNPQVAPAYIDLAQADALLYDTHQLVNEMHSLAEPLAREMGIGQDLSMRERDTWLRRIRKDPEFPKKLADLAGQLDSDWKKELFVEPEFFVGLFELEKETLEQIPLYTMQETFSVKTNIAQQTNISLVNQPFLNFRVRWRSPGASAVFANIWTRLFVDRANRLAVDMGISTEESVMRESLKIEKEAESLRIQLAELRSQPEYQQLLEVEALEKALYGSKTRLDMFGYVELHAEIAFQSGLVGELGRRELDQIQKAIAEGQLPGGATSTEVAPSELEIDSLKNKVEEMQARARQMRAAIAPFAAEYDHTLFEINQRDRIMAERLTTATFSSTRLKSGYLTPPISFGERAVPSRHPTGAPRSILAVVLGFLCSVAYIGWVLYREYLVPLAGQA